MALTIEEQLRQGLFREAPCGYEAPFDVALAALTGPDDDGMDARDLELLQWGVTFGAAFGISPTGSVGVGRECRSPRA